MSDQTTSEGIAGVGMFVAAFLDEKGAKKALKGMKEAKKSGEFYRQNPLHISYSERHIRS